MYRSNNKRLGTEFEREMCDRLSALGYWVHFIVPDARGAQPFDIIAVKGTSATAIDCKTSARGSFPITRLEDNQIMAFELWIRCGNTNPLIAVKFNERIYRIPYWKLKNERSVKLTEDLLWHDVNNVILQ